jgi:hypothetical protein
MSTRPLFFNFFGKAITVDAYDGMTGKELKEVVADKLSLPLRVVKISLSTLGRPYLQDQDVLTWDLIHQLQSTMAGHVILQFPTSEYKADVKSKYPIGPSIKRFECEMTEKLAEWPLSDLINYANENKIEVSSGSSFLDICRNIKRHLKGT